MEFSPRSVQILFLLLKAKEPIKTSELAEKLNISKRTIYRELDDLERDLMKFNLTLKRKTKRGLEIVGDTKEKESFVELLKKSDDFDPRNKEKRHQLLISALLKEDELQKLFYFSDMLQVSEPTVSHDLEQLEQWFQKYRIKIQRKSGFGIGLSYEEADYRRVMVAYITKYQDDSFIKPEIREKIKRVVDQQKSGKISNLTNESYKNFILYLTISIQRIFQGKGIYKKEKEAKIEEQIDLLAEELGRIFELHISKMERVNYTFFLKGCKLQHVQRDGESVQVEDQLIPMKEMVYEMANSFSTELSFELKSDDEFVEGLIAHLEPTITRLSHGIPIKNPMLEQIKSTYKDAYERATQASRVLEKKLNIHMPEDEIAFLAMHFGGAMLRIEQRHRLRRTVYIGVVCSSGIGISSLLSSEIYHHFEERVKVESIAGDRLSSRKFSDLDFIVSTYPIQSVQEQVLVNLLLTEDDLERIEHMIEKYEYQEKKAVKHNTNVQEATLITNEINSIIKNFGFYRVDPNITFHEAVFQIGQICSENQKEAEKIEQGILEREALSTQVIEEYEIAFLHTKTTAVESSKFIVVLPEEGCFRNPYFKSVKAIIVMLISAHDMRDKLAVSSISRKMFDDDEFLEQIQKGDEGVFEIMKETLESYFNQFLIDAYGKVNN
ncbi:MAG: BglG family transcription antiterminator [Anaerostipes sp.]|jgi:mannitol operon transcriptional antiterminator